MLPSLEKEINNILITKCLLYIIRGNLSMELEKLLRKAVQKFEGFFRSRFFYEDLIDDSVNFESMFYDMFESKVCDKVECDFLLKI